jgi:hypothetical protein
MVRIKMIDGIPCIVLDDGIIWSEKEIRQESRGYVMPENFTEFQQSKEKSHYKKVLEELKKKFGEI